MALEIFVKNYEDGLLVDATAVVLRDPTGTYGIRLAAAPNTVLLAADTVVPKDATGVYSYSGIDSLPGFDSNAAYDYCFRITRTTGDIISVPGTINPSGGHQTFGEAKTEVLDFMQNLISDSEAGLLVNKGLRFLANKRPWYWSGQSGAYTLGYDAATSIYTLPSYVKNIIGAYSADYPQIRLLGPGDFGWISLGKRVSGLPNTLFLLGQNQVIPDPKPDASGSISILYNKLFNLEASADPFPCNRDFSDAVVEWAKWKAALARDKGNMAAASKSTFEEMLSGLLLSHVEVKTMSFGDPDYSAARRR